jgi:deoxyribodipyrimidine photo-lyase
MYSARGRILTFVATSRDLPFDKPSDLPDVFTSYRKSVEPLREAPRKELKPPKSLPPLPTFIPSQLAPFSIPENDYDALEAAILKPIKDNPPIANPARYPTNVESAHPFSGGSSEAHKRIQHLLATASMTHYKDTRNGLLGLDFSTKLSAWLALGCITARQIHWRLIDFEDGRSDQYKGVEGYGKGENKGTAAVRFELLWRDYMRLCTRKFSHRLFRLEGFRNDTSHHWRTPDGHGPSKAWNNGNGNGNGNLEHEDLSATIGRFQRGETGISLIDASQRELYLTGYTSNRARQNVASFLAKHLNINWIIGAEWYEYCLVDYDVSSNWGNWQYVAGVGNDPRGEARVFNPVKQSSDYDPKGEYCVAWVEELRGMVDSKSNGQSNKPKENGEGEGILEVYQPWLVKEDRREGLGLNGRVGVEHPLKKIDFRLGRGKGGGGGGGGRYGGSSRGWSGNGWRGRGGGRGGRGGNRDRGGRSDKRGDMNGPGLAE